MRDRDFSYEELFEVPSACHACNQWTPCLSDLNEMDGLYYCAACFDERYPGQRELTSLEGEGNPLADSH